MAKGTVIRINQDGRSGHIKPDDGNELVYFQLHWVEGAPLTGVEEGLEVEFDTKQAPSGLQTRWVRAIATEKAELPPRGYRFLNPYNFVRYLPPHRSDEGDLPAVHLMGRCEPPPHDRWVGLSGQIECRLETITPLFISGSENIEAIKQISEKKKHYRYRFFRLNGEKAIPATSLRGSIRSVFEAVTNSCFSSFSGERLSYRVQSTEAQKLVPTRVEKDAQGNWVLRLLPGEAPFDPEIGQKNGQYAAPVSFYKPMKWPSRNRSQPPAPIGDPDNWQHGKEYYAVLLVPKKVPRVWRVMAFAEDQEQAKRSKSNLIQTRPGREMIIRRGWLCKTNQNTDNKHSERLFLFDNGSHDMPETVPLPPKVREKYESLILDYQTRHAGDVIKRDDPSRPEKRGKDGKEAYSRFVLKKGERKLQEGALVYARLRGSGRNLQVLYIAPVSWPRIAYDHSIGALLPGYLHRCDSATDLCPACRTFGWVHGQEEEGAYAGRVIFSHAVRQQPGEQLGEQTLSILGSPKPTTTRFYLTAPNRRPSPIPRSDHEAGYDGNNGQNHLRGRKLYRHYQPQWEKITLTPAEQDGAKSWDQNRTIHDPEGTGARFTFTVNFENLAPVELGALLWTLTLGGEGYHRLGYGKPLGLGSVQIEVGELSLLDSQTRYQSLDNSSWHKQLSHEEQQQLICLFQESFVRPYASDKLIAYAEDRGVSAWQAIFKQMPHVQDILTILGRTPPDLPVHYPYSPDPRSKGQFEWFVGNTRLHGPRKELSLATEDEGLPLILKDGTIW